MGVARVSGVNSAWTGVDRLTVGGVYHTDTSGRGELTVEQGGSVDCLWLVVGNRSRSQGHVAIIGDGSRVDAAIGFLGDDGRGNVAVSSGAQLHIRDFAAIGNTGNGQGEVTLDSGGLLQTNSLVLGQQGSLGTLSIGSAGRALATQAQVGNGASDNGPGQGTVFCSGQNAIFSIDTQLLIGQNGARGSVIVSSLALTHVGNRVEAWPQGTVDVSNAGRMAIGQVDPEAVAPGTIVAGPGGTLAGDGTIRGKVIVAGGTLQPGHSPGLMQIDGNLEVQSDGVLSIEVAGPEPTQRDRIVASEAITLGGTLNLQFINGYVPSEATAFEILSGLAIEGSFTQVVVNGIDPRLVRLEATSNGVAISVARCLGDFDRNDQVDMFDYMEFVTQWQQGTTIADFNLDGQVDFFDFLDFAQAFEEAC
ncbi:MAG: hypothetical protein SFZ23_03940 [Planctomycetota bacterium]|nr:hypothetical protein [Planctomycetota bacterium]